MILRKSCCLYSRSSPPVPMQTIRETLVTLVVMSSVGSLVSDVVSSSYSSVYAVGTNSRHSMFVKERDMEDIKELHKQDDQTIKLILTETWIYALRGLSLDIITNLIS